MNVMSMPVLAVSAGASAPMLWQGLVTGEMPMETVLTRFALVVAGVWMALSLLEALIGSTSAPTPSSSAGKDTPPPDAERPAGAV